MLKPVKLMVVIFQNIIEIISEDYIGIRNFVVRFMMLPSDILKCASHLPLVLEKEFVMCQK